MKVKKSVKWSVSRSVACSLMRLGCTQPHSNAGSGNGSGICVISLSGFGAVALEKLQHGGKEIVVVVEQQDPM
jgi:hypothetical protein